MRGNKIRAKVWTILVGVFVLGFVTGAALDGVYRLKASNKPEEVRGNTDKEDFFNSLQRELNLTPDQAAEIRVIVDKTRDEYRSLRTEVQPRYDALRQSARSRIRSLLTVEQQRLFDVKIAQKDAQKSTQRREETKRQSP